MPVDNEDPGRLYGAPVVGRDGTQLGTVNEVYLDATPGKQWVELLNTTDKPIDLNGWRLRNSKGDIARLGDITLQPGKLQVVRPQVGGWKPTGDAVVLVNAQGKTADGLSWNTVALQGIPKFARPIKAGTSLTRNPQGMDTDAGADWQLLNRPSEGTQSPASLGTGLYRVLFAATNYISLIAGILLWAAFLLIGLIARRFETLTGQRSYWVAMLVAPLGIIIYNFIQSYAFFTAGRMTDCTTGKTFATCQQGYAFVPLMLSGIAMVYVVYRFYGIARDILDLKDA